MLKFKLILACAAIVLVSTGYAEEKSTWQKFVEFFSPSSTVEGDGPRVVRDDFQLELGIAGVSGTFDAGERQRAADARNHARRPAHGARTATRQARASPLRT